MSELVIEVERRTSAGKGPSRRLRQQGLIPAVVYGGGKETVPVVVDRHAVTELLRQETGRNTVFLLKMKGTKLERLAMLRDAQVDPRTRQYVHLDFIRVMKGQRVKVEVPVHLQGEAPGVKVGGFLNWQTRSLSVECPADQIPAAITIDLSNLELGDHLAAGDVPLPGDAKLLEDPHTVVVAIEAHGVKVAEAAEAGVEETVAAAEEPAEPEVIRRGKGGEETGD
ncbi:MAG: 50S ribosomal protein L25 [Acidobacteriota bacterium]|jgi:large subunit ribosomal protein L25